MWRTTTSNHNKAIAARVSIHVPRVEDDFVSNIHTFYGLLVSIHVPRVEDDRPHTESVVRDLGVSIHVPRVEDDWKISDMISLFPESFNPRPPCGGRRCEMARNKEATRRFQSTSPVWRTTYSSLSAPFSVCLFQSTSPVWRTTSRNSLSPFDRACFNPRPPCGGRPFCVPPNAYPRSFNPRPPCGGRRERSVFCGCKISFNPRPPCGGRPMCVPESPAGGEFQSTSPVWRTTRQNCNKKRRFSFQSTSPVWRTTASQKDYFKVEDGFNPRPPCGGRRVGAEKQLSLLCFNPRPPCGGRQRIQLASLAQLDVSIHVPRVEDDPPHNGGDTE